LEPHFPPINIIFLDLFSSIVASDASRIAASKHSKASLHPAVAAQILCYPRPQYAAGFTNFGGRDAPTLAIDPTLIILQKAIDRLRSYKPPETVWAQMPLSRRAAVLILLFADRNGDLRVVITMRASTLSSYSGQAALPGGKAEEGETAFECARREAAEEIGLPRKPSSLPPPFRVEHLTEMPTNASCGHHCCCLLLKKTNDELQLAKTELVVRPCIALLHSYDPATGQSASVEEKLLPVLDHTEVAAVFSASFLNCETSTSTQMPGNLPSSICFTSFSLSCTRRTQLTRL
jgi:8-oxo-dGTP pyrophosphatase MutT (NUDIX family)